MRFRLRRSVLVLGLTATIPLVGLADEPEIPPFAKELPKVRSGEPVLKFNGRDLSGFYTYYK